MANQLTSSEIEFYDAILSQDKGKVQQLIQCGVNINVKFDYNSTPLHQMALDNNIEIARLLVDAGADINATNVFGITPLHIVAMNDTIEFARFLIEAGADINNIRGQTPLHIVARHNNIAFACLLLDAGADLPPAHKLFFSISCIRDIWNTLYLKHLVKLKCLGLQVSEENMSDLRERFNEELRAFEKQCKTEVADMKRQEIREGYRFSLCDVLTKADDELRKLLQVDEVRLKLEEVVRKMSRCSAYANMILIKLKRSIKTAEYNVKARKIIWFIVNSVRSIPDECVDMIASYFTDKDMKDLAYNFK